jgi:hypothetical protein
MPSPVVGGNRTHNILMKDGPDKCSWTSVENFPKSSNRHGAFGRFISGPTFSYMRTNSKEITDAAIRGKNDSQVLPLSVLPQPPTSPTKPAPTLSLSRHLTTSPYKHMYLPLVVVSIVLINSFYLILTYDLFGS